MSKYVGFRKGKWYEHRVISERYCGRCGYPVSDRYSFCPECGGILCKNDLVDTFCKIDADKYAYDAGYRDGSAHYELDHCPGCKNVADLQEALDANAKLRKELEAEHVLAETLSHYHEAAKAENEKLRLLVRGLDYCSDELNSAECDKCPLHDPADPNLEPKCVRMMRELGIDKEKYND